MQAPQTSIALGDQGDALVTRVKSREYCVDTENLF